LRDYGNGDGDIAYDHPWNPDGAGLVAQAQDILEALNLSAAVSRTRYAIMLAA